MSAHCHDWDYEGQLSVLKHVLKYEIAKRKATPAHCSSYRLKTHPRHLPGQPYSSTKSSYMSRLSRLLALGLSVSPTGRPLWSATSGLWFILKVINSRASAPASCEWVIKCPWHVAPSFALLPSPSVYTVSLRKNASFWSHYTFIYMTRWTLQMWREAQWLRAAADLWLLFELNLQICYSRFSH